MKITKESQKKSQRGITLISLVITIIILLILATVAINLAINSDGLFARAKYAADSWNTSLAQEEADMSGLLGKLEEMVPEEPTAVYAKLYEDDTLILSSTDYTDPDRVVDIDYGDISVAEYDVFPPWVIVVCSAFNEAQNIIIYDKIRPISTAWWFAGMDATTLDLTNLDTSCVTNMEHMFFKSKITNLDLSKFNTSNVTNMDSMFSSCQLTSLDLSNFDTSNVTNMDSMFAYCELTSLNLDLSNFNTSNVTSMSEMFYYCPLTNLDISNFDISNVTNMFYMFGLNTTVKVKDQATIDKFKDPSYDSGFENVTFEIKQD